MLLILELGSYPVYDDVKIPLIFVPVASNSRQTCFSDEFS